MKRKLLLTTICLLSFLVSFSQQPLEHAPKPYIDSLGLLHWNRHQPFYLRIATTPDDPGQLLESKKSKEYVNPSYLDTEGINYIRTHYAVDTTTKQTIKPALEILWEISADGTAPKSAISFHDAPHYTTKGQHFYGLGLQAKLSTIDLLSGVEEDYYSVNKAPFAPYKEPLQFDKEGAFTLSAYAVDNVGNKSEPIQNEFTVDLSAPKTYYNIMGVSKDNIIASNTKVYLTYEDNLSGIKKTMYKLDSTEFKLYDGKSIPTTQLNDGNHTLVFYSVDNVENIENTTTYDFYLDKLAPILASDVLGDRFIVNDQIYFSGRTKLKLTAVDNKSGVKEVLFSIDGTDFSTYSKPFYLPSVPGLHIVRYFAIDNMENETGGTKSIQQRYQEYKHSVSKIYVDLTGPSLDHAFVGNTFTTRDTMFVNSKTKIKVQGKDGESGLQYLSYSLNGTQAETRYTEPFALTDDGLNTIEIFGYDNVNNRNKGQFNVMVDNTPPEVVQTFSIKPLKQFKSLPVYPDYVKLYLAATDALIGADKISYSVNGGPMLPYKNFISGFKSGEANSVKVQVTDKLQNMGEVEINFWVDKM